MRPCLYTLLHDHKNNAFGTIHKNSSEMFQMEANLNRGGISYRITYEEPTVVSAINGVEMILSTFNSNKKTLKWHKNFFHLLDLAIYNAYILYQNSIAEDEKRKFEDLPFRLIEKHFLLKYLNQTDKAQLARKNELFAQNIILSRRSRPTSERVYGQENDRRRRAAVQYVAATAKRLGDKRRDTRYECRKCDLIAHE
uniref:PiggyBac transposable element-derived protein domain-containing protein n=1 Tax=Vespula pensylvanica TaxID=30213 RepID=A0A834NAF9_VESPE|nr:hypothetical protein H0235_015985 [Vespula pensylvanica]